MRLGYIGKFDQIYDEEGIARSLEKLEVTVIRINQQGFYNNFDSTLNYILSSELDFLMAPKWPIPSLQYVFDKCKEKGIKTITWHSDAFYELEGRHQEVTDKGLIYSADYVFTPEGYAHDFCKSNGINHHTLRQGIFNECCYKGIPIFGPYDVLFVGSTRGPYHTYREELVNFLTKTYGDKFLHIGQSEYDVRMDNLNNLIASSKVIIGESVPKPYYWSNRIYETIGRGGFCLHAYNEGLEKEYTIGKHFDVFYREEGFEKLKEKIDYWVSHPEEREKVANDGMLYTQQHHTLVARTLQLIETLLNL